MTTLSWWFLVIVTSVWCDGFYLASWQRINLEVFNKVLRRSQSLPVTKMIELIFSRVNAYYVDRRAQYKREVYGQWLFKRRSKIWSSQLRKTFLQDGDNYVHVGGWIQSYVAVNGDTKQNTSYTRYTIVENGKNFIVPDQMIWPP